MVATTSAWVCGRRLWLRCNRLSLHRSLAGAGRQHPGGCCYYEHHIGMLQMNHRNCSAGGSSLRNTIQSTTDADTYKNSKHVNASNREQHCCDDSDDEPEYLELVTHTADKMRSAVRSYVSEYCRPSSDNGNISGVASTNESNNIEDATLLSSTQCQRPLIKLVGILATTTPQPVSKEDCHHSYEDDAYGNERYSEQIATSCSNDGIIYEPWRVPPTIEALERAIHHANERLDVHGILVFYPVFDKLLTNANKSARKTYKCQATGVYYRSMDDYFRDLVTCDKDVEGYCRKGLRIQKQKNNEEGIMSDGTSIHAEDHIVKAEELGPIYPCTALAVYKIIESFRLFNGREQSHAANGSSKLFQDITMTIINRSEVLGLPLATMLSNQGATIYSVNIDSILQFLPNGKVRREHATTTVEECVRKSSVVVSGVPSNTFKVPTEWISKNATVINVATEESNFDEDTIYDEALGITYVPHVGRVTVAALQYNLMTLHKNYHSK